MALLIQLEMNFNEFDREIKANMKSLQERFQESLDEIFTDYKLPTGSKEKCDRFIFVEGMVDYEKRGEFYTRLNLLFGGIYEESKQLGVNPKPWDSQRSFQIEAYIPLTQKGFVPINMFEYVGDKYVNDEYIYDFSLASSKGVKKHEFTLEHIILFCKEYNPQNLPSGFIFIDNDDKEHSFTTPEEAYTAFIEAINE